MKAFNKILIMIIVLIITLFLISNLIIFNYGKTGGKPHLVEVSRLVRKIESNNFKEINLKECDYIIGITKEKNNFYNSNNDYVIREIDGILYRFDYKTDNPKEKLDLIVKINIMISTMAILVIGVMLYIKFKILAPFE